MRGWNSASSSSWRNSSASQPRSSRNLRSSRTETPSILPGSNATAPALVPCLTCILHLQFVGPGLGDELRGVEQALERPGVRPPAFELVPSHLAAPDVGVVHVRDLQLAAPRGLERLDDVE